MRPLESPCSIVFIPRKQSPFQPLITKSYRSCSGSSLFICLTFCSENHVKLTKGNISFLKLCLIWIVTSFGQAQFIWYIFYFWLEIDYIQQKVCCLRKPFYLEISFSNQALTYFSPSWTLFWFYCWQMNLES